MNAEHFIELVRKMREKQNAYYRQGRKQSDLIASKQLEKEVDRALLDGISFPVEGEQQIELFTEAGNEAQDQ